MFQFIIKNNPYSFLFANIKIYLKILEEYEETINENWEKITQENNR